MHRLPLRVERKTHMKGTPGFPRLLLLSSSVFNPYSGGGIMLSNLFRGWPRDKIAAVHAEVMPPDATICQQFYGLRREELGWAWPLCRLADAFHHAGAAKKPLSEPAPLSGLGGALSHREHVARWARASIDRVFSRQGLRDRAHMSPELQGFVHDFEPEVIYTLLGSLGFIRMARKLITATGARLVVHMMDDWPTTLYAGGWLGGLWQAQADRELRTLLKSCALRMAICEPMRLEYEQRYEQPFVTFHNALDIGDWLPQSRRSWLPGAKTRLLYSGSVLTNAQLGGLRDIAHVISELRQEGTDVELALYTPPGDAEANALTLEAPGIKVARVPEEREAMARLLSGADVLVLALDFDPRSVAYTRLSLPTKIPAYLISGTPILAYGPIEAAQIRLAKNDGWAHVVTRRDPAELKSAIRRLSSETHYREQLGRRSQALAARDYGAARIRPSFQQAVAQAAADDPQEG